MKNYNQDKSVYQASVERIKFIFDNFERIYISFSGGKDSGVMLNLVLQYIKQNNIDRKVGVMIMDNEANYKLSTKFMLEIIDENIEYLDVYWCCLPISLPCTVSSFLTDWQCWGNNDRHKWIQQMPERDYIVNYQNHKFDFFRENMNYDEFWDKFGEWYSQGKSTACLIGIRADESLNRFRAIANEEKIMLQGQKWTKKNGKNVFNCYPIYDWRTSDIWVANAKFGWNYNELYDLFYMAGVPVAKMRVASPFMSESKSSLNMYRVIDPDIWVNLCTRVHGANFVATYGKQISYHSFKLPEGHTWKSFTKFLLNTLPNDIAENFRRRFVQSLKYWGRTGRGLPERIIKELQENNIEFKTNGNTAHGSKTKQRVIIKSCPDHLDMLSCHNSDVLSWKRFAITILKNDHTCKYLGLAPTKDQAERQKQIMEKYKNL